ncbi:MAG: proline dehydrogenase [Gemmatimonadales bacterium]|nr:MAG: proline dehydrogenase [Gemmatimonadales bacterium]
MSTMNLARQLILRGSTSRWLSRLLSRRRFVQRAVQRFMPGEEMEEAVSAAGTVQNVGMRSILTLLGESVLDRAAADDVVNHYETLIESIAGSGLSADLSVKPTHLGLDVGTDVVEAGLRTVVARAGAAGRLVVVDMEASEYVDDTLGLYRRIRADHQNVGVCLQSYLYRTEEDLESLLPLTPMIRLVKGAYRESADLAWPKKSDVDDAFMARATRLLEATRDDSGVRVAFGTHDERMIDGIRRKAADLGLARDAFEIQMLYGIGRDLQTSLAAEGYSVRILISYGPNWFPWYMRRLAERPANVWFMVRSMLSS